MTEQKEQQNAEPVLETNIERGVGGCSYSGCNCPAFTGNADLCGNCGHNYATHW